MKYGFLPGCEIFPKMVIVNTSYVCNAKCIHCTHNLDNSSREIVGEQKYVDETVFKKLADECGPHGAMIRITGTGEPLMHRNLLELIKYAKDRGCKVSMITNGSQLTKKRVDFLLDIEIDGIEISIDACSKSTYEKIRVGLDFDKLVSKIEYLREQRDARNKQTNLIGSFVEQTANRHERDIAEEFWVPRYLVKWQSRVWLQYGKMEASSDRRNLMPVREPCPYPFERINMDSKGHFHLCAFDIDHETDYGCILDRSVAEIWRDARIDEIRKQNLERRFDDDTICSRCTDYGCRSWTTNFWKLHTDATAQRATNALSTIGNVPIQITSSSEKKTQDVA